MDTKISEEEFLRLQNQLIELRTANYTLEEQHARQLSRCQQLQSQVEALERECLKAHSSLNFAKKLKSADLLSQNERLQQKLQAQEDEFRLQNQTLLQELSSLSQENKRLNGIVEHTSREAESATERNEQVIKLQSEASALQRALSEERLRSAHEVSKLKGVLKMFSNQMDEKLRVDVFGSSDLDGIVKSIKGDRNCSGEKGIHVTDVKSEEEYKQVEDQFSNGNSNDVKLVSSCRLAQLELAEAMQETEKLKEEKEKRESLENNLMELQLEFSNYKALSEKKIEDSLKLVESEKEKQLSVIDTYRSSNNELENQVLHLKSKVNELELENEVLLEKMMDSLKTVEDQNQKLFALSLANQEKVKSIAKMEKDMCEEVKRLKMEKEERVQALEQQLADMDAEQSLRERKGIVMCRDLKRQLAAERKRVERLQERMREVLEGKMGTESSKVADVDVTSISSWSLMSGNLEQQDSSTRESSLVAGSPTNMNGNIFPQANDLDLEQESRNLLERLASLQEEKWALEEKVNQLEQGNASMVQDLMKKSEVIQFYCMDGRPDPQPSSSGKKGVKKLSDFLKTSEEEHLQECNTRMQRMLEELLTKNMYLQRDMEQMSKVVEKLQQAEKLAD